MGTTIRFRSRLSCFILARIFHSRRNPSVSLSTKQRNSLDVGICVSNTCSKLLEFSRRELIKLGLRPGHLKVDRYAGERTNISEVKNTLWQFHISRKNDIAHFTESIGFADLKKKT